MTKRQINNQIGENINGNNRYNTGPLDTLLCLPGSMGDCGSLMENIFRLKRVFQVNPECETKDIIALIPQMESPELRQLLTSELADRVDELQRIVDICRITEEEGDESA